MKCCENEAKTINESVYLNATEQTNQKNIWNLSSFLMSAYIQNVPIYHL